MSPASLSISMTSDALGPVGYVSGRSTRRPSDELERTGSGGNESGKASAKDAQFQLEHAGIKGYVKR